MVNNELIDLCRTVIAAIQDTDSFEAPQLRRLLLHIVPQLLVEIDILAGMLETLRLPEPPVFVDAVSAPLEEAADKAVASRPEKKSKSKRRKRGRK
jgi:hypothetical protein